MEHHVTFLNYKPGLKRAIAFKQANSAGSTWVCLNRRNISWSIRLSGYSLPVFMFGICGCAASCVIRSGDVSIGIDHWMAQSRNSSLHASSNRMTYTQNTRNITHHKVNMLISMKETISSSFIPEHAIRNQHFTWSLKGRFAKDGRFLAHRMATNSSLAEHSYIVSWPGGYKRDSA